MLSVSRRAHSSVVGLFTAALPWPFTAFRLPFLGLSLLFDCLSLTFHCLSQVVVCAGVKSILDVPRTLECEGHCLSVVLPPPFCRASTAFLSCFHRFSVVLPPPLCRAPTAFLSCLTSRTAPHLAVSSPGTSNQQGSRSSATRPTVSRRSSPSTLVSQPRYGSTPPSRSPRG